MKKIKSLWNILNFEKGQTKESLRAQQKISQSLF